MGYHTPKLDLQCPKVYRNTVPTYMLATAHAITVSTPLGSGVPGGGSLGCSNPPPRNFEGPPKSYQIQPDLWKLLKIAEFRMPTPQDVQKKGSKILKLPRFAIVLH